MTLTEIGRIDIDQIKELCRKENIVRAVNHVRKSSGAGLRESFKFVHCLIFINKWEVNYP